MTSPAQSLIKELSEFVATKFPLFDKRVSEKLFAEKFRDALTLSASNIQQSIGTEHLSETLLDAIYAPILRIFNIQDDVLDEFGFFGHSVEQDFQSDLLSIFSKYYDL